MKTKQTILFLCFLLFTASFPSGTVGAPNPDTGSGSLEHLQQLYRQGVAGYQDALNQHPDDEAALMGLAGLYQFRGEWEDAIDLYKRVAQINPENKDAFVRLGECYLKQGWQGELAARAFEQAMALAEQQPSESSDLAGLYFQLGEAYMASYQYKEAIPYYQKAVEINPSLPGVHYALGLAYYDTGSHEDAARAEFERELSLNDRHAESYLYLGVLDNNQGLTQAALRNFNKAVQLDPRYDEAYNWLGYLYEKEGQWDKARDAYEKAVEYGGDGYRFALAKILYEHKDYDGAIVHLEKVMESFPGVEEYQHLLADCYRAKGEPGKAREVLAQISPHQTGKILLLTICLFLPALITWLSGKQMLKKLPKDEGEERINVYHRFRQWIARVWVCGLVVMAFLFFLLGLEHVPALYGIRNLFLYYFAVSFLGILVTVNAVFLGFDRVVRGTTAGLREYVRIYSGAFVFFGTYSYLIFRTVVYFHTFRGDPLMALFLALVLAGIVYGFNALAPLFLKIMYRVRRLSEGEGRYDLEQICARTGVACRDIFVIETGGTRLANGGVAGILPKAQDIFLTSYLLDILSREEVHAIFLHEVGHLKGNHARQLAHSVYLFLLMFGFLVYLPWSHWTVLSGAGLIIGFLYLRKALSKRNEQRADEFVVDHHDQPEALVSALEKAYTNNYVPKSWKAPRHPSLKKRIEYIQKRIGEKAASQVSGSVHQ